MRGTKAIGILVIVFALGSALFSAAQTVSREQFTKQLIAAAVARAQVHVRYSGAYARIGYPNGDVAPDTGACTDEIIRIYRAVGIDLQKEVHEDMAAHLSDYPIHGRSTDTNIDHRRVPNLQVFFAKYGAKLPVSMHAGDYRPGDIVAWNLDGKHTHIGMVVDQTSVGVRHKVLHNIGEGPKIEDVLFNWSIIGHYRYFGPHVIAQ
jgi:hypothetical protein